MMKLITRNSFFQVIFGVIGLLFGKSNKFLIRYQICLYSTALKRKTELLIKQFKKDINKHPTSLDDLKQLSKLNELIRK